MNVNSINNTTIQISQDTQNTSLNNASAENPALTSPTTPQENNLSRTSELNFSANFISNQISMQLQSLFPNTTVFPAENLVSNQSHEDENESAVGFTGGARQGLEPTENG